MGHDFCFEFSSLLSRDAMIEVSTTEWESLRTACETLDDPRTPINIFHSVENIVAISLAAIIAGAEGPKSIARWAKNKSDWLATWLDLPDGKTPSRDCIRTFFARVDPTAFQACFFAWLDGLAGDSKQSNGLRIVAIDGKSLRHSFDTRKELRPLHLALCIWPVCVGGGMSYFPGAGGHRRKVQRDHRDP